MVLFESQRKRMIDKQIRARGIRNRRVLEAMEKVERHCFVPEKMQSYAYEDSPVGIGMGQTISQPYMVAIMTECLDPGPEDRVLEIGTGSGYQTAVLAEIVRDVYSVERITALADRATHILQRFSYKNVSIQQGDGSLGLEEKAPFDRILVTAGSPDIPDPLVEQLKIGGRLVIPVGNSYHQTLYIIEREAGGTQKKSVTGCVFVPLIGAFGWDEEHAK